MSGRVVDSNVFLHGRGGFGFGKVFLVPEVVEELKSSKGRNNLTNIDYVVRNPSEESLKVVKGKSGDINSPTSEVDEKLLALALDMGNILVTDDKALQNLALHLGVGFEGFLDEPASDKFEWIRLCRNCGSKVSGEDCGFCGSSEVLRRQVRCNSE